MQVVIVRGKGQEGSTSSVNDRSYLHYEQNHDEGDVTNNMIINNTDLSVEDVNESEG